ncbi:uncharacterized protein BJ171DRAFT_508553 [Polychytrium aggregatum]|uniref:uncharacterized protein n=1 Tax=Polychytrium aggregatum TaxID=110093 RepID=UPI0022FF21C5|nr:uncharacterized protein BJ171DRAFT_508553 [Polychytrium aggregatum]KAI9203883.1 hypothetical protein BJ171DRAFT_508553 [Polychytrium aggregatum]
MVSLGVQHRIGQESYGSVEVQVGNSKQSIDSAVKTLIKSQGVSPLLENPLQSAVATLLGLLESERQETQLASALALPQEQQAENTKGLMHLYGESTAAYHVPSGEPIFPVALAYLVNSSDYSILDTLLNLERTYGQAIEAMWAKRDEGIAEIQVRHSREIGSTEHTRREIGLAEMLSRHNEELDIFRATIASEIEELHKSQRQEYQDFVVKVYEEMQHRLNDGADKGKKLQQSEAIATLAPEPGAKADRPASALDPSEVITTAIKKLERHPSMEIMKLEGDEQRSQMIAQKAAVQPGPAAEETDSSPQAPISPPPKPEPPVDPRLEKKISELSEMGFSKEESSAALEITGQDLERSIVLLLENPGVVQQHLAQRQTRTPQLARSTPNLQQSAAGRPSTTAALSRESKDSVSTPPLPARGGVKKSPSTFLGRVLSNSGGSSVGSPVQTPPESPSLARRPFNPVAFLKEQQQKLQQSSAGAAATSGLKHVSSIFGKAFEALNESLGLDDVDGSEKQRSASVNSPSGDTSNDSGESFTVHFGQRVRTIYNLRLQVSRISAQFSRKLEPEQQVACLTQTTTSLYSDDLSAAIVLLTPQQFATYASGNSANKELIRKCQRSTEFHFNEIDIQLKEIERRLPQDERGQPLLEEGDFFITKHSNLPLIHVVFHLIIGDESLRGEMSPRSPILEGYRNILRTCHRCEIYNVSVPLLLVPDFDSDPPACVASEALVQRRGEYVMKATKGSMMEHTRSTTAVGGSSGNGTAGSSFTAKPRTIIFSVPRGIGPVVYAGVKERLSEIFRTT